jgi:hypothetical protein
MMGLYPVGTLVRLNTEELAVVIREHPEDPFRPQVLLVRDAQGHDYETAMLANTWERDTRGDFPLAIVEAIDAQAVGIDPLVYIENVSDRNT